MLGHQGGYAAEGAHQVARLKSIGVFAPHDEVSLCPLCSSVLTDPASVADITAMASDLDDQLRSVAASVPHITKLVTTLDAELDALRSEMRDVRTQLDSLHQSATRVSEFRDRLARTAYVQGRIGLYLESLPEASEEPDGLKREIARLETEIEPLRLELSDDAIEENLDSILSLLSTDITNAGRSLGLEHSGGQLRLDRRRLQVVADTDRGVVPMERIGSGANWVGYHIAAHVALHRWFSRRSRPVPGFVMFDQPSQIGFPPETVEGREDKVDRNAVFAMMKLIWEYAEHEDYGFQAIILEHAEFDDDWFQRSVIERWRDGNALIPSDWLK